MEVGMGTPQTTHPWLRIIRDVLLFDMVIFYSIGILFILAGWKTIHQYGNGLVWAGAIGVLILLVTAGWRDNRRQDYVALSKVMREDEAFYLLNRDNSGRGRFMLVGMLALIISLAIGWILMSVY
jgi:hypothetical protein